MKISFVEANEVLRREGMMPFPIEEIIIPDDSPEQAERAIVDYAQQYERWMWKQWEMKNTTC